MTEWDSTHSNINLKTFDIVMTPAFGGASIPIFSSRQKRRKEKIKNIFKIKKPLI